MLNREYFKVDFLKELRKIDGHASVQVALHNGKRYWICTIREAKDAYVLLEVYPDKPNINSSTPRDLIAVTYESISDMFFTNDSPSRKMIAGFGASAH